jgi:hypothetical protein
LQLKENKIPLTAIAQGLWDPVAILSAYPRVHGGRVFEINRDTTNPGGIRRAIRPA